MIVAHVVVEVAITATTASYAAIAGGGITAAAAVFFTRMDGPVSWCL